MNGTHYIGKRVSSFEAYNDAGPITGIALVVDSNNEYLAGDQNGYVLEVQCPYGTQDMANNILASISGHVYHGYRAENAILTPTAELGDGVTVNGVYSMLAYRKVNFGPGHMSEISAPGENDVDYEYPYISSTQREINRQIAQTRSQITKTAEQIRLEVANEVEGLSASFDVQLDSISAEIVGTQNAVSSLELDLDSITGRIQDAEGNIGQLELTATELRSEISGKLDDASAQTLIDQALDGITLSASSSGGSTTFKLTSDGVDISTTTLNLSVAAANISGTLNANQINMTGAISWSDLATDAKSQVTSAQTAASNAQSTANSAASTANSAASTASSAASTASSALTTANNLANGKGSGTFINGTTVQSPSIIGGTVTGARINFGNSGTAGSLFYTTGSDGVGTTDLIQLGSTGGIVLYATSNMRFEAQSLWINIDVSNIHVKKNGSYVTLASLLS